MGVERVLQVAAGRVVACVVATAVVTTTAVAAPSHSRERVAVIDLGPSDPIVRQKLAAAIVEGGLDPVLGDGIEDALGGQSVDPDAMQLAAALVEAQRAFGALDCKAAVASAKAAVGIAAARQAAGIAVPELPRAWTYVLLCADRTGDPDAAMQAATRLRALGGSADVPRDVWMKYPAVDTMLDREQFPIEIKAEVDGADVWIDFERVGTSPLKIALPAGEHVIAAAKGSRRGWAAGTAVKTQATVAVPMAVSEGRYTKLAHTIAAWNGKLPPPAQLAQVFAEIKVRVAIVRRGDTIQAWGQIGRSEPPYQLGADDGAGTLAEAPRLVALIADRLQGWNDRAPDPDRPLLTEDPKQRVARSGKTEEPTRWWVYATVLGAIAAGAGVLYLTDQQTNTQRVELHYP
jgi:hypothetical protein